MLARAFDDDPLMGWIFPDPEARRRKLPTMFALLFRHGHLPRSASDVIAGQSGIRAAALWDPPGGWRMSGGHMLRALPGFIRLFGRDLPRVGTGLGKMEEAHPRERHWYLAIIGTDPACQGQGLGSRLLRSRLDACDTARLPAYLESSKESNVPYYQGFGFRVTEELRLARGGPAAWAMWREPGSG